MTTKLEQAEAIIAKVDQMRKWQKEFFDHRDALALRKAKELEKEIDTEATTYSLTSSETTRTKQHLTYDKRQSI